MVGASGLPVAPTLVASERRLVHRDMHADDAAQQRQRIEHIDYVRLALESAQKCSKTSQYMRVCSAAVLLRHQSFDQRGVASGPSPKVAGSKRGGGGGGLIGLQRLLRPLRLLAYLPHEPREAPVLFLAGQLTSSPPPPLPMHPSPALTSRGIIRS